MLVPVDTGGNGRLVDKRYKDGEEGLGSTPSLERVHMYPQNHPTQHQYVHGNCTFLTK